MPRHTVSWAPGRALISGPYPLPNLILQPVRRQLQASHSESHSTRQITPAPDTETAVQAVAAGFPFDPNWRSHGPAIPPIPYPPKTPEQIAESQRLKKIRQEIRKARREIGTLAGYQVPDYEAMEEESNGTLTHASESSRDEMGGWMSYRPTPTDIQMETPQPEQLFMTTPIHIPRDEVPQSCLQSAPCDAPESRSDDSDAGPLPEYTCHTSPSTDGSNPLRGSRLPESEHRSRPLWTQGRPMDALSTPPRAVSRNSLDEDQVDGQISPAIVKTRYKTDRKTPILTTPHQPSTSVQISPTTSVSMAEQLLDHLFSEEESDSLTTLSNISASALASSDHLFTRLDHRYRHVIRVPRSQPSRLRQRLDTVPKSIVIPSPATVAISGEGLPEPSEASANAIRNINVDIFRRSVRFSNTMIKAASDRLQASSGTSREDHPKDHTASSASDTAQNAPDVIGRSEPVTAEEVEDGMCSPMSIDPKTGQSQRASWPHPLPARETGGQHFATRPNQLDHPVGSGKPPTGDSDSTTSVPPGVDAPDVPTDHSTFRRVTLLQPVYRVVNDGSITPLRPVFHQLRIPVPPSPLTMGVLVNYKQPPTISPLSRGLVVPSAPPSRGIMMPQLKACQNFLLAKKCQASQRRSTRDHNLALFVMAQQSNKKLVILNNDTQPRFVRRVIPKTQLGDQSTSLASVHTQPPSEYARPIPTFFQPGQALYPMNAVGSYIQPVPNPFYGNQPNIPAQQSDANFFLRQTPTSRPLPTEENGTASSASPMGPSLSSATATPPAPIPDTAPFTPADPFVATTSPVSYERTNVETPVEGVKRKRTKDRGSVAVEDVDDDADFLASWGGLDKVSRAKRQRKGGRQ